MAGRNQVVVDATMNISQIKSALKEVGYDFQSTAKKGSDSFDTASKKIGGSFSSLGSIASTFGIPFSNELDHLGRKIDGLGNKTNGLKSKMGKMGLAVGAGIAIVGVGIVKSSLKSAETFEAARASLEASTKSAGQNFDDFHGKIQSTEDRFASLGFSAAEVDTALATSTISTHDVGKSMERLGLAADLARMKNIPLSDATLMVNKALQGQLRPLKALGVDIPVAAASSLKLKGAQDKLQSTTGALNLFMLAHHGHITDTSKDYPAYLQLVKKHHDAVKKVGVVTGTSSEIMKTLTDRLGGQADAFGKTHPMDKFKASLENLKKEIGDNLLPVLKKVVDKLTGVIQYFSTHKGALKAVEIFFGVVLVAALVLATAAAYNFAAALWLTGIPEIILGITLLIAGIVLLVLKIKDSKDTIVNVMIDIANALLWPFRTAFNLIADGWNATVGLVTGTKMPHWNAFGQIGGTKKPTNTGSPDPSQTSYTDSKPKGKAVGGTVVAGMPYIIGERGQETFVPRADGTIIPHGIGMGNQVINVQVTSQANAHHIANEIGWILRTQVA